MLLLFGPGRGLNREDGREAQGRILNGHSVPEVRYKNGWHMFDGSLINFFPRPKDGVIASVDEIAAAVAEWYAKNPGFQKNGDKIFQLMRKDGWEGWKAAGPPLLANCPFYRVGYLPARTHGWDATMAEYDRKSEVYEYGYQVGHRALFSLRPGESFVREAGNRGLHVNMDVDPNWDGLKARAPENDLVYVKEYLPGYRGGLAANGIHRYAPNLAKGDLERGAEVFDNLTSRSGRRRLRVKTAGRPGVVVIPMISPYVYLGGRLKVVASGRIGRRPADGLDLDEQRAIVRADLFRPPSRRRTERRSTSRTRSSGVMPTGCGSSSTGRRGPRIACKSKTIFSTPRARCRGWTRGRTRSRSRPTATRRSRRGRFPAGSRPTPRSTRTRRPQRWASDSTTSTCKYDACWWKGGTGMMTVPVEVPGDLVALGFSAQFRRGARRIAFASRPAPMTAGPGAKLPCWPGRRRAEPSITACRSGRRKTRKVLLRFEMTGNNTAGVQSFRVDADYRDPMAAPTVRPFRVVHRWKEGSENKSHSETIERVPAEYVIEAGPNVEMISVRYEMGTNR